MLIYVIRHGETDWNVAKRLQGREDIPLNETGIKQAEECANVLKQVKLDAIITSPLKRASKMSEVIQKYHPGVPLIKDERFIERDFGIMSGMTYEQRQAYEKAHGLKGTEESVESLQIRIAQGMEAYKQAGYHAIAIVSHGGTINRLLYDYSGGTIGTGMTRLKNACISLVISHESGYEIPVHNLEPGEFSKWLQGNQVDNLPRRESC